MFIPPTYKEWQDLRKTIHERDSYKCTYCGKEGGVMGVDHKIPISEGGSSELENLTTACCSCNSKKSNRTPEQWLNGDQASRKGGVVIERFRASSRIRLSREEFKQMLIELAIARITITELCAKIGISRQAFYVWKKQGNKKWITCRQSTYDKLIAAYEELKKG